MRRRGVLLTAAALVLTGCSGTPGAPEPTEQAAPPPAPPAACLLDPAALGTVTGLAWAADQGTASDTRCVYDPAGPAAGGSPSAAFLAVEIAPAGAADSDSELDGVAAACADGSRAALKPDTTGFVCRFRGGSVFAAVVRAGQLITVSASAVPEGTTAAKLVLAVQQQLDTLGG